MEHQTSGDFMVINNRAFRVNKYQKIKANTLYYEVIRIIEGKIIFLEDHLNRLKNSCQTAGIKCPGEASLIQSLTSLIENENIMNGNVKIIVYEEHGKISHACYFIPHKYPSGKDYREGVELATYQFERPDPNIKKWNENFRQKVNTFIREKGIYEAVLINQEGYLTEGSRSNLFFTDSSGAVWNSPTAYILPGITRKYVYQICKNQGIEIREKLFSKADIIHMSGCFISGTSPKILPVKSIDQTVFDVPNEIISSIMKAYNLMLIK